MPWVLAAMLALASCGILGANEEGVVGEIDLSIPDVVPPPSAPDTVAVSTDFVVSLLTVNRGCDRGGDTEVTVVANEAFLTPYDYKYTGGDACTSDARTRNHDTTLRFDVAGQARVVITARDSSTHAPIEIELPVWVR